MPIITGYNSSVAAGTETIFPGGVVWVPPTAAATHGIVSADAADAAAGDNARTVRVSGYTSTGARASEIVELDGVTPVPTVGLYVHIDELEVLTAGTNGVNAGLITATGIAPSATTISAAIEAGMNKSNGAILYAGVGEQLHVRSVLVSASGLTDAATSIEVRLGIKRSGGLVSLTHIGAIWSGASTSLAVPQDILLQNGDWLRLDATSSDAAAKVAASINYVKL